MRAQSLCLALTLACLGPLPAQEPTPPVRPPAPAVSESPTQELLGALRALRLSRQEARRSAEAFELERQVLAQEIAALEARLEALRAEESRLKAEQLQAGGTTQRAEEAAEKELQTLEKACAVFEEARGQVAQLQRPDSPALPGPPGRPEPTRLAEAVAGLFRSLEIQAGRLREVVATQTEVRLGEETVTVLLLSLGGAVRLWRSLDGKEAGWVDRAGRATRLSGTLTAVGKEIGKAVEMLRRRRGPALVRLPIPLLAEEDR